MDGKLNVKVATKKFQQLFKFFLSTIYELIFVSTLFIPDIFDNKKCIIIPTFEVNLIKCVKYIYIEKKKVSSKHFLLKFHFVNSLPSTKIVSSWSLFSHQKKVKIKKRNTYKYKLNSLPKERHSSKQVNILILKTILFISQNMFQSIHTSSSVAKSIIKTVNIITYFLKMLQC